MRIKSYFASSVTEAMGRARVELGAEAMIIATNRTSGDAQRLGAFEVVFGLTEEGAAAPVPAQPPAPAPAPASPARHSPATEGLERLRARMEDMRKSVSKKREQASAARVIAPPLPRIVAALTKAGFAANLAEDLARGMQARAREQKQDPMQALRAELGSRLRVNAKLGAPGASQPIVALVGPPGAGKTSTVVKLAVNYGIAAGRPVRLISTDTRRLGGSALLAKYAQCMDIPLETAPDPDALDRCLNSGDRRALVLIDTPGCSPSSMAEAAPVAAFLSKRAGIDVHLVLPSYASAASSASIASRFKPFFATKAIFTGLDLCDSFAPMLTHAIESETTVSFLGNGPQVPEDLLEASAATLTSPMLPALMEAAAPAA